MGRHLNRAPRGALAGQLPVRVAVLQRATLQPHADAVAAVGCHPDGVHQGIWVAEPVVAWARYHQQIYQLSGYGGHRGLLEFGIVVGVLAHRDPVTGLQRRRADRRHHVVASRTEHRRHADATTHRKITPQSSLRHAKRYDLTVTHVLNAVGAELDSVDCGIRVGAGHRDVDVAAADP